MNHLTFAWKIAIIVSCHCLWEVENAREMTLYDVTYQEKPQETCETC